MIRYNLRLALITALFLMVKLYADQGGNDSYGYMWTNSAGSVNISFDWISAKNGTMIISESDNDPAPQQVVLPFTFHFYGEAHNDIYVAENGWVTFTNGADADTARSELPTGGVDSMLAPYWSEDLTISSSTGGGVYHKTVGSSPNRKFVVEWDMIEDLPAGGVQRNNFQLVLYETTNLIKFQYNVYQHDTETIGANASIGIKHNATTGISYAFEQANSVGSYSAVLFHNKNLNSGAQAQIFNNTQTVSTAPTIVYSFHNLQAAGPEPLGKADHFSIANPFTSAPTVTSILINSTPAFIQNSSAKPEQDGYATWEYDAVNDSLIIRTSPFNVRDSLQVKFIQTMPAAPSTGNSYQSSYNAMLDSSSVLSAVEHNSWSIDVSAGALAKMIIRTAANNGGRAFGDSSLTTDENLTLYAAGYDSEDNYIDDQVVNWSSTGSLDGVSGSGVSYTFSPSTAPTSGTITAELSGISDGTGSLSVGVGSLTSLTLRTAANNGGAELADSSMTTDEAMTLYAAGYDGEGNYRGDETVVWSSDGSLDAIASTGSRYTFSPSTAPTSGRIIGTSGIISDASGTISVGQGALASLTLRSAAGNGGIEFDSYTLSTDETVDIYAAGYDAESNYIADQTVSWSSTGGLEAISANGSHYEFAPSTAPASGSIVGRIGTINDATGSITVTTGAVASILIRSASNNGGEEVGVYSMSTDEELTLYAAGYDGDGNYVADQAVAWSSSGNLDAVGATSNGYTFSPSSASTSGTIIATFGAMNDETGTITVSGGALSSIMIRTDPDDGGSEYTTHTMTTDDQDTLYAAGYDGDNNYLGDQEVTWSSDGNLDGVSGTGANYVFSPSTAPTSGRIIGTSGIISDASGTISVGQGALASLTLRSAAGNGGIEFDSYTLSTDETVDIYAAGYDAESNYIADQTVSWSSTGGLEAISANGSHYEFAPSTAPASGSIVGRIGTINDATGSITVTTGAVASILIRSASNNGGEEVGVYSMSTDEELTLYAAGYDGDGNYVADQAVAWSSSGNLDAVGATSNGYTFSPSSASTSGTIIATFGAMNDETGTITVSGGALSSIMIRTDPDDGGSEYTTHTMTTDDQDTLYAAGYDGDNNYLGDQEVTWSSDGNLDGVSGTGANYVFSPSTAPTSGTITAELSGVSDGTGSIQVNVGAVSYLTIRTEANNSGSILTDTTLTVGEILTAYAAGFDAENNYAGDIKVNWNTTGSLEGLGDSVNTFYVNLSPSIQGSGTLKTSSSYTDDNTGTIDVVTSTEAIHHLEIRTAANNGGDIYTNRDVIAGQSQNLFAASYDRYDSYLGDINAKWSISVLSDSIGYFSNSDSSSSNTINFTKVNTNTITISVDHLGNTIEKNSGVIRVSAGSASRLEAVGDTFFSGKTGSELRDSLVVKVLDDYDNDVPNIDIYWNPKSPSDAQANPSVNSTNALGISKTKWTLKSTQGYDSLYAIINSSIDSVLFRAEVNPAANIAYVRFSPDTVSEDQKNVAFLTTIRNDGQDDIIVKKDQSYLKFGTQSITLEQNQTISGGGVTSLLRFEAVDINLNAGQYADALRIYAEEGASIVDTVLYTTEEGADVLTVNASSGIDLTRVSSLTDSLVRGMDANISVEVHNTGEAKLRIDEIFLNEYGLQSNISPALPYIINGGENQQFEISFTVDELADIGDIALDAKVTGLDINSETALQDSAALSADSWYVFDVSEVEIRTVNSALETVKQGQKNIEMNAVVKLLNGAPVTIDSLFLKESIGWYHISNPPFSQSLNSIGDSLVFNYLLEVDSASATGTDRIRTEVFYTNRISADKGNKISDNFHQWDINPLSGSIEISSLSTEHRFISQGQQNLKVDVKLKNEGVAAVVVDSVNLIFQNGGNYLKTAINPNLPFTLGKGLERSFQLSYDVAGSVTEGPDTFYASIVFREQNGAAPQQTYHNGNIKGSWTVQLRPSIVIDSVSIRPSVVSVGQSNIRGLVYLKNETGNFRAAAQIDSAYLTLFNGLSDESGQFEINRISTPTIPHLVPEGSASVFEFIINTDPLTPAAVYTPKAKVYSKDPNDNRLYTATEPENNSSFSVERSTSLTVEDIWAFPDTISQFQDHGRLRAVIKNGGEATGIVNDVNLSLDPSDSGFDLVLRSHSTPFNIAGGGVDTLVFSFGHASGLLGDVDVDFHMDYEDGNSAHISTKNHQKESVFFVQESASLEYVNRSLAPNWARQDSSFRFKMKVYNDGEASVHINHAETKLILDSYEIPLDNSSSGLLPGLDTTELVFENTLISLPKDEYLLSVSLSGSSNDSVYNQTLSTGSFLFGDDVSISALSLVGQSLFLQGDTAISVHMTVVNSKETLKIDDENTTLFFRHESVGGIKSKIRNLRRVDGLDSLKSNAESILKFKFDLDPAFDLGITTITGQISLDNENLVKTSSASALMEVVSNGYANLLEMTLYPDTVISGQAVSFEASFENTGTADLILIPDSTYLEIAPSGQRFYLSNRYSIKGGGVSTVHFLQSAVDPITPGIYGVNWYSAFELQSGEIGNSSGASTDTVAVIASANVVFTSIIIDAAEARKGQNNFPIILNMENTGASNATLLNETFDFKAVEGGDDRSSNWLLNNRLDFPYTLKGGASRSDTLKFTITTDADTGLVFLTPSVEYADVRSPSNILNGNTILANDSVRVIQPAAIQMSHLTSLAPNMETVNLSQSFDLKFIVENLGSDSVKNIYFTLLRDDAPDTSFVRFGIAAEDRMEFSVPRKLFSEKKYTYTALIDSAFDKIGNKISVYHSTNNRVNITAQSPAELKLLAEIISPSTALDSSIAIGQLFKIKTSVINNGVSEFGAGTVEIVESENFSLIGDTSHTRSFTNTAFENEWLLEATAVTEPNFDLIRFLFSGGAILDVNTHLPANIVKDKDTISVKIQEQGSVSSTLALKSGAGENNVLSTGQSFRLSSVFNFNLSVADSNRNASIILPEGFSVLDSSSRKLDHLNSIDSVFWDVVAPLEVKSGVQDVTVKINAKDKNTELSISDDNVLSFSLQEQSRIYLTLDIVEPQGAIDDTISEGQSLKIRAIANHQEGTASIKGGGTFSINTGADFELEDGESQIKSFSAGGESVYWQLRHKAGNTALPSIRNGANEIAVDNLYQLFKKRQKETLLGSALRNKKTERQSSQITLSIEQTPLDINSNEAAWVANPALNKEITIRDSAAIEIVSITSKNVVSTGQYFNVTVKGGFSSNLTKPMALFEIPPDLGDYQEALALTADSAVMNITTPENYNGEARLWIKTILVGVDDNNGKAVISEPDSIEITIQKKSALAIGQLLVSPLSVKASGQVSYGQKITLTAVPIFPALEGNLEYASLIGSGAITLQYDENIFEMAEGDSPTKAFTQLNEPLQWSISALDSAVTSNLNLAFSTLPKDENSLKQAILDPDSGRISIPIRVKEKTITSRIISLKELGYQLDITGSPSSINAPILAFEIINSDYPDTLHLTGLQLAFKNNYGESLNAKALSRLFSSIVVNRYEGTETSLEKTAKKQNFVHYFVNDTAQTPLQIIFDEEALVTPNKNDTLIVFANTENKVHNRSFITLLNHISIWDHNPDILLGVVDEYGEKISRSAEFEGENVTIITGAPKEIFRNYPNPFGREHKETNIIFYLQEDSDVEIRIFTLHGELVKTIQLPALAMGLHERGAKWDGKNDRGHSVINDVYICTIDIKPLNGDGSKRFITKIAYIK
jgi:hypothetical protein